MKIHPEALEGHVRVGELDVPFHDTRHVVDQRPVVLLVHGTGGTTATHFRTLYPMFATSCRVVGVDLQPGNGPLALDGLAAQVIGVLNERCLGKPVHLVGYSLGALVAATVAARLPESVRTLSLVAGWVKADADQRLRNDIWRRLYKQDREALREFATWSVFGNPYLAARTDAEVQALVRGREFPEGIAAQMNLNRDADISGVLGQIAAPALVVGGTHDQMVPVRAVKLLYGGIPDARYAQIDAGHAIPAERPAQLFQLINEFILDPARCEAGNRRSTLAV